MRTTQAQKCCTSARCQTRSASVQSGQPGTRAAQPWASTASAAASANRAFAVCSAGRYSSSSIAPPPAALSGARSRLVPCSPGPPRCCRPCPGPAPSSRSTTPPAARWSPPAPDRTARMYVCGITPYDATHLGHAATYLAFDLVNRVWRDAGHAVHYVQNVTDIDDPLLERADRDREDWIVLGMRETALFREDMTALRVLPPEDYVGAVESIPRIVGAHRGRCSTRGWPTSSTTAPATSTTTSRRRPASAGSPATTRRRCCGFFAERGGDPDRPGKRQPLDPMLWRGARPGRAVLARPAGRGGPARAGTSSAPRSRWTPSAWASTCRAAAATWSSRTTSTPRCTPRRSPPPSPSPGPTCTRR